MTFLSIDKKNGFICDMDGVIYHGNKLLPGVKEFVTWLNDSGKRFLFLTNCSERSPKELSQKLAGMGLAVGEEHFYTSGLVTADFIKSQNPSATAYAIGGNGLTDALCDAGIAINDVNPDYVVLGETSNYDYGKIERAIQLVLHGAKLLGTNPDLTLPSENGLIPGCRALLSPIELTTGKNAYYLGKPNPLMMKAIINILGVKPAETLLIGDRMDTDIIFGIESGIETALVLSGITKESDVQKFAFRPTYVFQSVGDVLTNSTVKVV
uniref:Acid sugar phosphatase n=1 Tax=Congzhengia minquanensis TaxID=2763657 RepID=A0A926DKM8_9FIRM|nr:HAD family hydrolase [Congzhengia minquanensis]